MVLLCHMIAMPIVCLALKTDILKLEGDFFNGNRNGDCVFYLFVTNEISLSQDVSPNFLSSWSALWIKADDIFENMLKFDHALQCFKNKIFLFGMEIIDCWHGNSISIECIKMIIQDMFMLT